MYESQIYCVQLKKPKTHTQNTVYFHLYEVQELAKLRYGHRSQKAVASGEGLTRKGCKGTFQDDGNIPNLIGMVFTTVLKLIKCICRICAFIVCKLCFD